MYTYIYALAHPETGDVHYVGLSRDPHHRFTAHLNDNGDFPKSQWIRELREQGLTPNLIILDRAKSDTYALEQAWIAHFRNMGAPLTNATHHDADKSVPPINKPPVRVVVEYPKLINALCAAADRDKYKLKQFFSSLLIDPIQLSAALTSAERLFDRKGTDEQRQKFQEIKDFFESRQRKIQEQENDSRIA